MPDSSYHITLLQMKTAALSIPAAPEVFVKLGRLLKEKETEMSDIISLVEKDPSLVSNVLRLSNTAFYSAGGEPIATLEEGINRIGFQELFRIVGMASIGELYGVWNLAYNVSGDILWRNSLAFALTMEQLAAANGEDPSECYTIGILRSLGKLIVNNCAKTHNDPPIYNLEDNLPLLMWEKDIFNHNNPETADLVLESWGFPESALIGMRFQYQPEVAPQSNRYALMLNIAGSIAEKISAPLPGESTYWDTDGNHLEAAGLTADHVKSARGKASLKLSAILESMEKQKG